jgi:lipopolysaccharide export LptBFGC system permease protein LptF
MLVASGMTCLGIVLCYISMYFVVRLKEHTILGLGGIAGVLLGGVVGQFLVDNTGASATAIWWYPIGLLIGLALWIILRFAVAAKSGMDLASAAAAIIVGPSQK